MSDAHALVGNTPVVLALNDQIDRAAGSDAKVLITGESGTGKEVAARLIHERSRRRIYPLTTINCAGIPDSLLESELFGFRRGSFTGALRNKPGLLEKAHNGTLFMDEVAEMSLRMQGTVLRFLETGEIQPIGSEHIERRVDVRVLAATNCNLDDHVTSRAFRLDLYYRLNVIHLHIPPLSEHSEDVGPLLHHFIDMYSRRYQTPRREVSAASLECLKHYGWPGNIRQLMFALTRCGSAFSACPPLIMVTTQVVPILPIVAGFALKTAIAFESVGSAANARIAAATSGPS